MRCKRTVVTVCTPSVWVRMMASVDAFLIVSTKRDRGHIGSDTPNQSDPLLQGSLGKKAKSRSVVSTLLTLGQRL